MKTSRNGEDLVLEHLMRVIFNQIRDDQRFLFLESYLSKTFKYQSYELPYFYLLCLLIE